MFLHNISYTFIIRTRRAHRPKTHCDTSGISPNVILSCPNKVTIQIKPENTQSEQHPDTAGYVVFGKYLTGKSQWSQKTGVKKQWGIKGW